MLFGFPHTLMKKFLILLFSCLPMFCYSQITVSKHKKSRTINAMYIIAIESKNLMLHRYYTQKYAKREKYAGIPRFSFDDCKQIKVVSDSLKIQVSHYSDDNTFKDTTIILALSDITAIIATKNEATYGKSGVMHILALPLLSAGFLVTSIYNFIIGSPEDAFPALGASVGFGLLLWVSVKSLQNEKKYEIAHNKWQLN